MVSLKRKRLDPTPQPRRATRQHPVAPEEHQLRSGRVRANTNEKTIIPEIDVIGAHRRRSDPSKATKITRNNATSSNATATSKPSKENIEPQDDGNEEQIIASTPSPNANKVPTVTAATVLTPDSPPPPQTRLVPPDRKPSLQQQKLRQAHSIITTTSTTTPTENISTPKRTLPSPSRPTLPPGTPRSDRNIDKVVFGNICFKAWYPSYYGKEVLGDASGNSGAKDGRDGGGKIGGRIGGGKRAGLPPPLLDRLYVCPCCFRYSKELVLWWEHVRCCEVGFGVPGRKVYTHPKDLRSVRGLLATDEKSRGRGRKRSGADAGSELAADEEAQDGGEWSVWEVDGEKDRLFCQNLSLFAKLFLDNKSVFFDVTGFNYFLLVYTPPPSNAQPPPSLTNHSPPSQPSAPTENDTESSQQQPPTESEPWSRPQVVGFFSKEKLSWDNNNLACILVFPPWQRKGLGALLMGVSYEISRREGVLGGPEKPISELGRKGYKRYWAGEIARWLLELDVVPSSEAEAADGVGNGGVGAEEETLVNIDQCSRATWIVPEDCLAVLRDMGVIEEAGLGRPPLPLRSSTADAEKRSRRSGSRFSGNGNGTGDADPDVEGEVKEVEMVPRVRVDKAAVRRWVEMHGIDLTRACDPEGFVEGYAVRGVEDEVMDEV